MRSQEIISAPDLKQHTCKDIIHIYLLEEKASTVQKLTEFESQGMDKETKIHSVFITTCLDFL